jgi:hypothetical protein
MPYVATRHNPLIVHIISAVFWLIALIILLHLAFVLLEANPANPLVDFFADLANWFSWLFKDMFTGIEDQKVRAVVNYGIAALVFLAIGGVVSGIGRRRSSHD